MKENNSLTVRRYDIDWLRIMLILSVFFFHIGMFFNNFGWHIKNNERVSWLDPLMAYLHLWRMPLLFLISGVGTYFALGQRNLIQYLGERSRKLLIPLVFGMFVIVPPQVYIEKHEQYSSFINFIPHITEGSYPQGNFSWHHLWFVLYLFVCSAAAIPVIVLLRTKAGAGFYKLAERIFKIKGSFLILVIPLFIVQNVMLKHFPQETHALIDDWAYISYNFLFFLYGYVIISGKNLIEKITGQRRIYGIIALLLSALFFIDFYHSIDPYISNTIQLFLRCTFEWSMALTIIGYASRYLNKEHKWRKHLNEAIYPFYILHQTIIIIVAYQIVDLNMVPGLKALILTFGSFALCAAIYILFICPFKISRLLFGMHVKTNKKKIIVTETAELKAA